MSARRIRNASLTALGLSLPLLLACAVLIVSAACLDEPASSVKTPNPSKAPWYFSGPTELLVYFDPRLAGLFGVLFYPWCALYLGAVGASAALEPRSLADRPKLLFAAAFALGTVLASPWLWFALRELGK